ncbi:MAG: hypothetical protein ACRDA5_08595 [Clostridium sp.]
MINNSKPNNDNCNDYEDDCNHSHNHCNDNDCCHDDHHHNNCCPTPCTTSESCNFKPNCVAKCCNPLVCECEDVEQSHCVPIIAERVFDCSCIKNLQFGEADQINNADIEVQIDNYDKDTMPSGSPICIDKVSTQVESIGIDTAVFPDLSFKVGTQSPILFKPLPGSPGLATDFQAIIKTSNLCCNDHSGIKTKILSTQELIFSGSKATVTITGRIGCTCFRAHYTQAVPFVINGNFPGIHPMSIFSKLCLPKEQKTVKLNLSFSPCISIDCITPDPNFVISPTGKFKVSAEYSFLVDSELTATTTEKLGVFVTDKEIKCNDGSAASGCKSKCH